MLNPEQELLKLLALGRPNDFPFLTNDPKVNHAVDNHMTDQNVPYDESLYLAEIEAWKKTNGLLLGWVH